MARVKISSDVMKFISVVESITRAHVKECILGDPVKFIIEENQMGKAIGKGGANLKRVESVLKKKVQFVEYSSDIKTFVKNFVHPLRIGVEQDDKTLILKGNDTKTRGLLIGRDRKNLNLLQVTVKRYFNISEIKVE